MRSPFILAIALLCGAALAEKKPSLKVKDLPVEQDTTISIKKGAATECVEYEILDGTEEVFGMPDYDRMKAMASWKTACGEWKDSMREMNKENRLLTLNCNSPKATKEDDRFTFLSTGTYKVKVKVREKAK